MIARRRRGAGAWRRLKRPAKYEVKTEPRGRPDNVKEQVVAKRVQELRAAMGRRGRVPAPPRPVRQELSRDRATQENLRRAGQEKLFEEYRYSSISPTTTRARRGDRLFGQRPCDQENLIAQLKAARVDAQPLDNLHSNWAYMRCRRWRDAQSVVRLLLPASRAAGRKNIARKAFDRADGVRNLRERLMRLPCQIVKTAGESSTACCPGILVTRCCDWRIDASADALLTVTT